MLPGPDGGDFTKTRVVNEDMGWGATGGCTGSLPGADTEAWWV